MFRNQGRDGEDFDPSIKTDCFSSTSSPKVVVDMGRTESSLGETGVEGDG